MSLDKLDCAEADLLQAEEHLLDKLDIDFHRDFAMLKQKKGKLNESIKHFDIAIKSVEKAGNF